MIAPNHIQSGTGRILFTETAGEQAAISGKYLVKPGDIIYSKIRPALNKVCIATGEWLCSADMYPVAITAQDLRARFLLYFILSEPFVRLMVDESMRVAMPKVNREKLAACPLVLPSPTEQQAITDYVRLYAFLSQVLTFADADLEKLYAFARHLRRRLTVKGPDLPREVQQNIDMESYRIQQTSAGKIALERRPGVLDPVGTKSGHGVTPEEMEALSRIIAELNERFGLNLGPEHRVTLGQMMERLDADVALDASARVNTRENVRLTFDQKVEHVIQEIVDSNFDLYKRITDDRAFGEVIKNMLFDQYVRAHRQAEELIKRGESKTLEFKSTFTDAVLETIAAFLNTEGGDLLIGVADDGSVVGVEGDQRESDDKFTRHLAEVVRDGLGDRAGTRVDATTQIVQGKTVCVVSCQRSLEPVFLEWKGTEAGPRGDFFVRRGPGSVKLPIDSASEYIRAHFPPQAS